MRERETVGAVVILVVATSHGDTSRCIRFRSGVMWLSMGFLLVSWFTCLCRESNSDQLISKNRADWVKRNLNVGNPADVSVFIPVADV